MVSQLKKLQDSQLTAKIFYLGLFLTPFVFLPGYVPAYEVPRVIFVLIWVEFLAVLFLVKNPKPKLNALQTKLVLSLFLIIIVSSVLGKDFYKSIIGNYYRLDGILTIIHLISLSIIGSTVIKKSGLNKTVKVIFYSSYLVSILVVLKLLVNLPQFISLDYVSGEFFGNPNFLAGYLLLASVFSLPLELKKIDITYWIYYLTVFVAILSTGSLSAIALFLLTFFSLIISKVINKKLLSVFIIFMAVFSFMFVAKINMSFNSQQPFENRVRIFNKSMIAFKQKPIFGWGWANFDYAFESVDWPIKYYSDVYVDKAHSNLLEYLVTTGVVGLFAYLTLTLNTIKLLFLKKETSVLMTLLLFIVHSQTNIISITNEMFYWLTVGIAWAE